MDGLFREPSTTKHENSCPRGGGNSIFKIKRNTERIAPSMRFNYNSLIEDNQFFGMSQVKNYAPPCKSV